MGSTGDGKMLRQTAETGGKEESGGVFEPVESGGFFHFLQFVCLC